ncbi:hypothetical protein F1188_09510 [Roseospira marina]|uniref:Uncharacterized protein n=1 Tax=Roseospira marina TaxID=140057 RepID=A0A5M6ICZ3_9PROT|nr:hypothetical protein [Roseospira marina]KAA5605837.1 hypothetical protein F1188_09510 [Roseospira marina]MBB4313656.1 NAD/NADP transhydrogenase beta subunit [Roseospira marina]MBB5086818.1 NAD/NADP transhydrogenase beta subunit [Roseospira marina]
MVVIPEQAQAIQALVLLAAALLVASQAFRLPPRVARAGLVLGALCLGVAVIATIVTWPA